MGEQVACVQGELVKVVVGRVQLAAFEQVVKIEIFAVHVEGVRRVLRLCAGWLRWRGSGAFASRVAICGKRFGRRGRVRREAGVRLVVMRVSAAAAAANRGRQSAGEQGAAASEQH